jgi:hypothetical protein
LNLSIGGTGMLAEATRWLAREANTLVVARRATRFCAGDERLVPYDLDWSDRDFHERLERALNAREIRRALLWLHKPEPVLPWLLPLLPRTQIVLVLGSLGGNPEVPAQADLLTVRLGSKAMPDGGRRWLTDEEISAGAIAAFATGRSQIVGELRSL